MRDYMDKSKLLQIWQEEENAAHIHGWDFSHIDSRHSQVPPPWDYKEIIQQYLKSNMKLMDYDTGGGEFLLSLQHPYGNTAATEGFAPNVELCKEKLIPLGIDFKECADPKNIPYADNSFDIMINRHGSFDVPEIHRLLRSGGLYITQQVGEDNDRDLVKMVMPDVEKPYPGYRLDVQREIFEKNGFKIIKAEESFNPICFYDIGAFVWFARIIEWEFPGFSVDKYFNKLLEMQSLIEQKGKIEGTTHRYLIVAQKI
jgi:SAM-dependent methyltransferase